MARLKLRVVFLLDLNIARWGGGGGRHAVAISPPGEVILGRNQHRKVDQGGRERGNTKSGCSAELRLSWHYPSECQLHETKSSVIVVVCWSHFKLRLLPLATQRVPNDININ